MKYKLLKDTPTQKAGTIFSPFVDDNKRKAYQPPNNGVYYYPEDVENNPEWFEKLKAIRSVSIEEILSSTDFKFKFEVADTFWKLHNWSDFNTYLESIDFDFCSPYIYPIMLSCHGTGKHVCYFSLGRFIGKKNIKHWEIIENEL